MTPQRRRLGVLITALLATLAMAGVILSRPLPPIRVGVLHSLTGTMAISETAVVDATLLAIEEINAAGGLLGRTVEAIVVDGRSDWDIFAAAAERLIVEEQVAVVFGCWTSACRKTVKPVFERHNHLLVYPVQYEGLEQSANILYTGAAPNQQIIPAVKWSLDNLGKRFFLVGSDYVFPRTANAIIGDYVTALQGEIVGKAYIPLGSQAVDHVIAAIVERRPDVILNSINGDSNVAFFAALRAAGITPAAIPTVSFSIAEAELPALEVELLVGDYAAWNYFQSLDTAVNRDFVARFQARYGTDRVLSDPLEAAYNGVMLWAQAVARSGSSEVALIRETLLDQSRHAPSGAIYTDPHNRHTWKTVRIGQIRADGQFDLVWDSSIPIRPEPFPPFRTRSDWQGFLDELYRRWDGHWASPVSAP